jgi:general secretion pathway protein F
MPISLAITSNKVRAWFQTTIGIISANVGVLTKVSAASPKPVDLQLFSMEMATFLRAGLSLPEAIELLKRRLSRANDRNLAENLFTSISEGKSLSLALEQSTGPEANVLVALVRSSEQSGLVAEAFERFSNYQERLTQARRKLVTAMIYPSLLVVVGCAVVLFLLLYVVPKFADVYSSLDSNLPWASALLLRWGQFIGAHPTALLISVAAVVGFFVIAFQSRTLRDELTNMVLSVGLAKKIRKEFELGRFYYTMSLLLGSGLPITKAIELSRDVLGLRHFDAHKQLLGLINQGLPLSEALHQSLLSTDVADRLVRSGENSGAVNKMLEHAARIHEDDTWRTLERFTRIFEPVSMVVLGLLIGAIVVLMYLPIFELSQAFE